MISHRSVLLIICLAFFDNKLVEITAFSSSKRKLTSRGANIETTLKLPLGKDQVSTPLPILSSTTSTTKLHAASKKTSAPQKTAEFEYQELKIQIQAMQKQDIKPSQLSANKRIELEGYVKRILERRDSILPLNRLGDALPQTQWRMVFSTEPIMSNVLPKDATIVLNFLDEKTVEYSLQFSKTLGLKRLTAKSSYTVDVSNVKSTME
jgi:hypothetical protein